MEEKAFYVDDYRRRLAPGSSGRGGDSLALFVSMFEHLEANFVADDDPIALRYHDTIQTSASPDSRTSHAELFREALVSDAHHCLQRPARGSSIGVTGFSFATIMWIQ